MEHSDRLMKDAIVDDVFPGGVVLVANRGVVLFFQAYGFANRVTGRAMTRDTVFDLASLTKPLATAPAILKLIQSGRLQLDQTLESVASEAESRVDDLLTESRKAFAEQFDPELRSSMLGRAMADFTEWRTSVLERIDPDRLPRHVAIIMDGNGRWAKARSLPRVEGHRAGIRSVRETVETAARLGLDVITLYAFSTENWKRPRHEVLTLMGLLKEYIKRELKNLRSHNLRFRPIGRIDQLDKSVQRELQRAVDGTADCTGTLVQIAHQGDPAAGLALCRTAVEGARQRRHAHTLALALLSQALLHQQQGDRPEVREHATNWPRSRRERG